MKSKVHQLLLDLFKLYLKKQSLSKHERIEAKTRLWALSSQDTELFSSSALSQEPIRIYTDEEKQMIDTDCRGFLIKLEQLGIIDPIMREDIMDELANFPEFDISLDQFKRLVLHMLKESFLSDNQLVQLKNWLMDEYDSQVHH